MQSVGRLLAGVDDPRPQLLQLLVDLLPVVAELLEDGGQRLRERRLEIRVVVELHVEVVTDRVLDLRRLRLRAGPPRHLPDEVLVEDRNGRHPGIDPPGFQVLVGDGPQLRRNPLHAEPPVPEVLARQYADPGQGLVVPYVVERLLRREHQVEASGQGPERRDEFEAQVLVVEGVEERVVVVQIVEAVAAQERHDGVEAGFELPHFVFGEAERIEDVLPLPLVVAVDRLLEVVADADVVDHEALVLGRPGDAVHPRDGLQQVVGDDHPVEIQHLLDRRVEAREQHVVDDEDGGVAAHTGVLAPEGQLEALDVRLVPGRVRMGLQMRRIVVAAGDDHGRSHGLE